GHGQHLADAQAALDYQAGDQRGQSEGLAGTGGRLDQAHAVQRQLQVRVTITVGGGHGAHSSSSLASVALAMASSSNSGAIAMPLPTAENTVRVLATNSRSAVRSANGSRARSATS